MNITINDDGSVCIKNDSYLSHYDQDGNLKAVIGSLNAPKKIAINYPKKEIGELTYKVSVDTSDLDKLEEQLTRIKQLMQDVETKPKSTPQFAGKLFIKDAFINSAGLKDVAVSYKLEQDTKAELADLRMRANQQDVAINELKRVMETQQQAWSQAVSELNNRTWCSQK
ncbi:MULTISPECIES: hypothetical protein [Enterobacterales]|uniref:hypothetical protein n=1 Tax=Enterobacterales TaxID=91347 RepID=UPI001F28848D|nr:MULTISPECIES: hypothetical protein [Enterobacterales]MCF1868733.1 hypothetical protein [Klebsiella pneumoniae]UWT99021.1 hypothetical protein N1711_10900 [Proteus vulgaris]